MTISIYSDRSHPIIWLTNMLKSFIPNPDQCPESSTLPLVPTRPDREPVQIIIIGSEQGIESVIRRLYLCRFAEVHE